MIGSEGILILGVSLKMSVLERILRMFMGQLGIVSLMHGVLVEAVVSLPMCLFMRRESIRILGLRLIWRL